MSGDLQDNHRRPAASSGASAFTQIENSFARARDLSPAAKLVGLLLATYSGIEGLAFPGMARLIAETGLGRDAVKRGRHELLQKCLVEPVRTRGAGGRFVRVEYRVTAKILHFSHKPES